MTWFERLTGCSEGSPDSVREQLTIEGPRLRSLRNNQSWLYGELETPTLAELRARVRAIHRPAISLKVQERIGDVQQLHRARANSGALFQVASQFNLLEMASPALTPEHGVGIYEEDFTQGPACAIAAGAGTIFRNYFVNVKGQIGQTASNQIDCLADIAALLDNPQQQLWQMVNGYALPSRLGLVRIYDQLTQSGEVEQDRLRQSLRIGLQWNTQVTLDGASHTVSQAYCSAMPVAYTAHDDELWEPFATLILEAAYEATLCSAVINAERTGKQQLFLTLLGGGAFGNNPAWIFNALRRALSLHADSGLEVAIVSYSASNPDIQELVDEYS